MKKIVIGIALCLLLPILIINSGIVDYKFPFQSVLLEEDVSEKNEESQSQSINNSFNWHDVHFPFSNSPGHTAVTILPDGNSACATYDSVNCLWGVAFESIDFKKVIPLSCGEDHLKKWNKTGYESQDHWCKITLDLAAQNGNLAAKSIQASLANEQNNQPIEISNKKSINPPVLQSESEKTTQESSNPIDISNQNNTDNAVTASPPVEKKKVEIQWTKDAIAKDSKEAEFRKFFKPRKECEDPNLAWEESVKCVNEKASAREKFNNSHK